MPIKFNIASRGLGLSLNLNKVVGISKTRKQIQPSLESEIELSTDLINMLNISADEIDALILVNSLPRRHSALLSPSILRANSLKTGKYIEIGSHCGSILDAIHYCFTSCSPAEKTLLLCIDSFLSSYHARSADEQWKDGGGAVYFEPSTHSSVRLHSYVSGVDTKFLEIAHVLGKELEYPFIPNHVSLFSDNDEANLSAAINLALSSANITFNDLSGVICVNRSEKSQQTLMRQFPNNTSVFSSRKTFSHTGGGDILNNLSAALSGVKASGVFYYILVGTGLGYVWQAMVLSMTK